MNPCNGLLALSLESAKCGTRQRRLPLPTKHISPCTPDTSPVLFITLLQTGQLSLRSFAQSFLTFIHKILLYYSFALSITQFSKHPSAFFPRSTTPTYVAMRVQTSALLVISLTTLSGEIVASSSVSSLCRCSVQRSYTKNVCSASS